MTISPEEYLAKLATVTGLSAQQWSDFLSCTPEQQALIAQGYKDQNWVKDPDTFGQVMAILGVIGTIAGVVTGVAGAVSAIQALKSL